MVVLRRVAVPLLFAAGCLAADSNEAVFRDKILPILTTHCASCHGGAAPASSLSVADLSSVLNGGKHGSAITPGSSASSLLIQYVRGEKTPKMPMGGSLPDASVAMLAAAIDEMKPAPAVTKAVNPYAAWLFSRPKAGAVPTVTQSDWTKNPIDAFILAKLEEKGLSPAPPASKRALLRRVYFDLIGLPPTPEEVRRIPRERPTPDAYEKIVDRLLADPRYGERWGRHWLDLVRFAESDGFAIDGERPTAWRYRDYVIRSFNKDKPYDRSSRSSSPATRWGGSARRTAPSAWSRSASCAWAPGRRTPISRPSSARMF